MVLMPSFENIRLFNFTKIAFSSSSLVILLFRSISPKGKSIDPEKSVTNTTSIGSAIDDKYFLAAPFSLTSHVGEGVCFK